MRKYLGVGLLALFALGFIGGAGYLVYWQRTGIPTEATVTGCTRRGRAISCRGSWMVDGRVTLGEIENVGYGDVGQRIEVRVLGNRAIRPGLRLPLILLALGIGIAYAGSQAKPRK